MILKVVLRAVILTAVTLTAVILTAVILTQKTEKIVGTVELSVAFCCRRVEERVSQVLHSIPLHSIPLIALS